MSKGKKECDWPWDWHDAIVALIGSGFLLGWAVGNIRSGLAVAALFSIFSLFGWAIVRICK